MIRYFTILLAVVVLPQAMKVQAQNVFVVNSWDDREDLNPGNGICYTIHGECTLRAAIDEVNATPNGTVPDSIFFNDIPILGWFALIEIVGDALPEIRDPVFIDGTTAGGEVILDGSKTTASNVVGIYLQGNVYLGSSHGSTIKGLSIGNFNSGIVNGSDNNTIQDNYIGVLSDGTNFGNSGGGIEDLGENTIIEGNVIGFNDTGIWMYRQGSRVWGNFIGTDPAGRDIGNVEDGIKLVSLENVVIGGQSAELGNTIGFNGGAGIFFWLSSDNIVRNNYIGTDASGRNVGNGEAGIEIYKGENNIIGGLNTRGNIIAFNSDGIQIVGGFNNKIRGNYIGTNPDGDSLGNYSTGVKISCDDICDTGYNGHKIGYNADATIPFEAPSFINTIAFNGGAGVRVENAGTFVDSHVKISIRGNKIYSNSGMGIDLGPEGETENDIGDSDQGANTLINYPDVAQVGYHAGRNEVAIEYSISSDEFDASYPLKIDIYLADDAANGQGKTFVGTDLYTTPNEVVRFDIDAASFVWSPNDVFVLTATDVERNTSEFSPISEEIGGPGNMTLVAGVRNELLFEERSMPSEAISKAYPNPFNHSTTLTISPGTEQQTHILMFDALGRQVRKVFEGRLPASPSNINIEAGNLPNGIYWLKIETPTSTSTQSIILQR